MHRPHEFGVAGAPAHAARNRQRGQRALDKLRQQLGRRLAALSCFEGEPFAFVGCGSLEVGNAYTTLFCESDGSRRCVTVFIERDADRRSLELGLLFGLLSLELFDEYGKPTRARVSMDVAVRKPCRFYGVREAVPERLHEGAQGLGREFFGSDLDEKVISLAHSGDLPLAIDSAIGNPSASRLL